MKQLLKINTKPSMIMSKCRRDPAVFLIGLCCLVYFTSYITRLSYGATITEILIRRSLTKSAAGLVSTGGFFAYGIGQILSGILGDRYRSKILIFIGLLVSSFMNIILPFAISASTMLVIWTINGFAQALLWPPMLKTLTIELNREKLKTAFVWVTAASSVGTVMIYLIVPFCITWFSWKTVFFAAGGLGAFVAFFWLFTIEDLRGQRENSEDREWEDKNVLRSPLPDSEETRTFDYRILMWIVLAIILQGTLRDGIITWLPSYLVEIYHLDNAVSILLTVVLPLFSIISVKIAASMYGRVYHNEMSGAAVLFCFGAIGSGALILVYNLNVIVSIVLAALITGSVYGINLILISIVPSRFVPYGKVSTVSGILNAFTYLGSAVSAYAIGKIADQSGWQFTIGTWAFIASLGTLVSWAGIKSWKRFIK